MEDLMRMHPAAGTRTHTLLRSPPSLAGALMGAVHAAARALTRCQRCRGTSARGHVWRRRWRRRGRRLP
eukprot:scaffold2213_cov444-Prasinococcus_capsulatus_cf.AAC.18